MSNYNEERFPGNEIHATALIYEGVKIGKRNRIGPYCIIGAPAEWKGHEHSGMVVIGNDNTITGLVTIDSGGNFATHIEDDCYLMKGAHVGHECLIESGTTISCGAKIGGHSHLQKDVNIGLNAVVHQKQTIAVGVMIGMGSVVTKKLKTEPYKKYAGNPARLIGDNDAHPNYTAFMNEYPKGI